MVIFTALQAGVFDLALLEEPQIDQAQAVLLTLLEFVDVRANLSPRCVGRLNRLKLTARKDVQKPQPRGTIKGKNGFVLRVNTGQVRRELAKHGNRCRLIIDEYSSLTADRDFTPHDDRAVIGFIEP